MSKCIKTSGKTKNVVAVESKPVTSYVYDNRIGCYMTEAAYETLKTRRQAVLLLRHLVSLL